MGCDRAFFVNLFQLLKIAFAHQFRKILRKELFLVTKALYIFHLKTCPIQKLVDIVLQVKIRICYNRSRFRQRLFRLRIFLFAIQSNTHLIVPCSLIFTILLNRFQSLYGFGILLGFVICIYQLQIHLRIPVTFRYCQDQLCNLAVVSLECKILYLFFHLVCHVFTARFLCCCSILFLMWSMFKSSTHSYSDTPHRPHRYAP